jgi:hypothetical protein
MPAGGVSVTPGSGADSLDNLESFIELIKGVSERLVGWQENLATLGVELEHKADEDGAPLVHARETLDHLEHDLVASGQEALNAVEHLASQAEAVAHTQLPESTAQLVHLDAAIEAQVSHAIKELQADAEALDHEGYDALKTASDAAEHTVGDAQQSLEAGFHNFVQEMEDTTRLVESTAAAAAHDLDEKAHEVEAAAQRFSATAIEATRVWREELPPLVTDFVAEHKREVEELYQAFDEAEVAGFAEFEHGLDAAIKEAGQSLDSGKAELEKSVTHAEAELKEQDEEAAQTLAVAQQGHSTLSDLDDGSFLSDMEYALGVVETIAELLLVL